MEKADTIKVQKELIPYKCDIVLAGALFTLQFNYNSTADLITVDLYKGGSLVCAGEPLVYGIPLWKDVYVSGKFPALDIVPIDLSGESQKVTYKNLGESVLLIIDNGEVSLNE